MNTPVRYVEAIRQSGLSIYDSIEMGDPDIWIPTPELEELLDAALRGASLTGLPIRTRAKRIKEYVCQALGYPVPRSFTKTRPRFPGQFFDVSVQKSNNLQIWNEEIDAERRYVIVGIDHNDVVVRVRVVDGVTLQRLDTTGTLTRKFQARFLPDRMSTELITDVDTQVLSPIVRSDVNLRGVAGPTDDPEITRLLTVEEVFRRLTPLLGSVFPDTGSDQERTRAAVLHQLACRRLGYSTHHDDGRFPDVRHQLLELKLQTSPTIDLGQVSPDDERRLNVRGLADYGVRHCDVRYAVFGAETDSHVVTLTHLFVVTGERFFERFPRFEGRVVNQKLQIPLPADFLRPRE